VQDGDTRQRLLDAAEELFGRQGYESVSVRDIARRAGVNVAGVNYHFGGKEQLYAEALRRHLAPRRERILAAIAAAREQACRERDVTPLLRAFVTAHLGKALRAGPGALMLMAREMIEPRHGARVLADELVVPVHRAFREALLEAAPRLPRESVDWVLGSIVGQVVQFVMRWRRREDPELLRAGSVFPPPDMDLDTYVRETVEHVVRFSRAGIAAFCGEEPS